MLETVRGAERRLQKFRFAPFNAISAIIITTIIIIMLLLKACPSDSVIWFNRQGYNPVSSIYMQYSQKTA